MEDPPWSHARDTLLVLVAGLVFLQAMRAFFASVYFQSLVSLSLNASLLYVLVLFAPAAYLLVRRRPGRIAIVFTTAVLAGARLGMNVARGTALYLPLSALVVAAFLALLPLLLHFSRPAEAWSAVGVGFVLALALDASLAVLGTSRDLTVGPTGLLVTAPLAVAVLVLAALRSASPHEEMVAAPTGRGKPALIGLALGAWLFLQFAILGSPFVVSRWNELPLEPVALGILLGLLVPVASLVRPLRPVRHPWALTGLNAAAFVGLLDYTFFHSSFLPVFLLLTETALVLDLFLLLSLLARSDFRGTAVAFLYAALLLLLLLFVFAFSLTYAFVPLGALWQGAETVLLPAAALLALLVVAWVSRGFRTFPRTPPLPRGLLIPFLILPLVLAAAPGLLPPTTAMVPAGPLRVLTYNVHQGFNNAGVVDPDIYVEVIEAAQPDIVALQESDTARFTSGNVDLVGYLARHLGYDHSYGPPTREQSFGVALLSRYPILEASYLFLPSTEAKRPLLQARLSVGGANVWLVVVHLGLEPADRDIQAAEVLAHTAGLTGSLVLAGDFNACPGGLCPSQEVGDGVYAALTAAYRDAWTEAGFARDDPDGWTFSAQEPGQRIDYVLVSPGVRVLTAERVRSVTAVQASDHLPVLAVLEPGP